MDGSVVIVKAVDAKFSHSAVLFQLPLLVKQKLIPCKSGEVKLFVAYLVTGQADPTHCSFPITKHLPCPRWTPSRSRVPLLPSGPCQGNRGHSLELPLPDAPGNDLLSLKSSAFGHSRVPGDLALLPLLFRCCRQPWSGSSPNGCLPRSSTDLSNHPGVLARPQRKPREPGNNRQGEGGVTMSPRKAISAASFERKRPILTEPCVVCGSHKAEIRGPGQDAVLVTRTCNRKTPNKSRICDDCWRTHQ